MAMSLEELLAKEGFKEKKTKMPGRASFQYQATSAPPHSYQDQRKSKPSAVRKTDRVKSDIPRSGWVGETTNRTQVAKSKGILTRNETVDERLSEESLEKSESVNKGIKHKAVLIQKEATEEVRSRESIEKSERVASYIRDAQILASEPPEDFADNENAEGTLNSSGTYKDIYSHEIYSPQTNAREILRRRTTKGPYFGDRRSRKQIEYDEFKSSEQRQNIEDDINMDHRKSRKQIEYNRSKTSEQRQNIQYDKIIDDRRSRKQIEYNESVTSEQRQDIEDNIDIDDRESRIQIEYNRSKTSVQRKNIEDDINQRYAAVEETCSEPAIDEAAIRAVISILSGYMKRFLRDEDFRSSFHHNCLASLSFSELDDHLITESKVLANLEQAIEVVERAAEDGAGAKELKKASLQLSVITGLNSNELKDGFTSGIPNSKLSACAHLYLSVVYKLQRKDKVAAKHLLQVFCDSPFQARTILLPELWEDMFLPHLVHLREWYNEEVNSLGDAPNKGRKLKLLEKVYNEIIDSGTYQFAVYYKDWLSEGVESPSIPSISVPSVPFRGLKQGFGFIKDRGSSSGSFDVGNPLDPFSPQPVVSKRIFNAVFVQSRKWELDDVEGYRDSEIFPNILTSSESSPFEEKRALPSSSTAATGTKQINESDDSSHHENEFIAKGILTVHEASTSVQGHLSEPFDRSPFSTVNAEANEHTLKRLARSVSAQAKPDGTLNLFATSSLSQTADRSIQMESLGEESHVTYDSYHEESSFSSIPKDFVCPLTGLVFEDPVSLETGHTFEREAITEWLDQGNRTCPVSGKTLECQSVPATNFILRRVINSWKLENGSKIQKEEALLVIHQLLTTSTQEERMANAKHLISLGGLRFLIRKFQYGNLEEKSRVASILCSCIEAASVSRHYVAKNIKKSCVLELIRSEEIESKEKIVLLLVEMMCLNRRKDINLFLNDLKDERIMETLHSLFRYLRTSPPEQRPLVAVLLLHFDFLVDYQEYSVYREEAVDAITSALEDSSSNDKLRASCCRALLILGGRFSSSGKIMTEDWILKQSGFLNNSGRSSIEHDEAAEVVEESFLLDDDDEADIEEWLRRLTVSLLCDGKKSFLLSISKCLGGTNLDLVRVCLTTVAWLSSTLASFSDNEFPLAAFSSLITKLKEALRHSDLVEHKILASMSLFNFSKIPECRIMLTTFAKEIGSPLRDLAEVTWTAKKLYAIIYLRSS